MIDHQVQTLQGETISLSKYRGSVLLVVNTASECGYTPQYAGLEKVYEKYKDRGLVVVGFPSNDFGAQEPGSAQEIATFCQKNYGVTFPMMAKVHAKGPEIAPAHLPRLFDRFYRADPARAQADRNHGLGLAIVAAIARMHGGQPFAESALGRTRIGLLLPRMTQA